MIRLGVTGTDTGVGKTIISAALIALLRGRRLSVAGMKPVETGVVRGSPGSDAMVLRAAAGACDPIEVVCPIALPEPLAPLLAAERAGAPIRLEKLDSAFHRLSANRDAIIVEGAGGLAVPLSRELAFDSLFRRWELDLVVVAGNRLGVVNHILLTLLAARTAGLRTRGVVLNSLTPKPSALAEETNLSLLRELLPELPVIAFPWLHGPKNPAQLADAARAGGLAGMLATTHPLFEQTSAAGS